MIIDVVLSNGAQRIHDAAPVMRRLCGSHRDFDRGPVVQRAEPAPLLRCNVGIPARGDQYRLTGQCILGGIPTRNQIDPFTVRRNRIPIDGRVQRQTPPEVLILDASQDLFAVFFGEPLRRFDVPACLRQIVDQGSSVDLSDNCLGPTGAG